MESGDIRQQYLNQFDSLDLSKKHHRRIGVYLLKEFYASLMADVGREYFNINEGLKRDPITSQWGQILSRAESLDNFTMVDGVDNLIPTLKNIRNKTHHNTDYDPPRRQLVDIRDFASVFREWLFQNGSDYYEYYEELDPRSIIIGMIRQNINNIMAEQMSEDHDPSNNTIEKSELLRKRLDNLDNNNEITVELIEILQGSISLQSRISTNDKLLQRALMDFYYIDEDNSVAPY